MLTETWGNRNSHSLLVTMQDGAASLDDNLAVSYRTKCALTKWPSHELKTYIHAKICTWTFTAALLTNAKAAKMAFSRWMNKHTVVHSDYGILLTSTSQVLIFLFFFSSQILLYVYCGLFYGQRKLLLPYIFCLNVQWYDHKWQSSHKRISRKLVFPKLHNAY